MEYPFISFEKKVEEIRMHKGTVLTIWLTPARFRYDHDYNNDDAHQVEIQVLKDGRYRIFTEKNGPTIEFFTFDEYEHLNKVDG